MKTLQITENSNVVRLLAWLNGDNSPGERRYIARTIEIRYPDSCALTRRLIVKMTGVAIILLVSFLGGIVCGAGLWGWLWMLCNWIFFGLDIDPTLYSNVFIEVGIIITGTAFLVATIFCIAGYCTTKWEYSWRIKVKNQVDKWLTKTDHGDQQVEPKEPDVLVKLYRNWKDKVCSKIEYISEEELKRQRLVLNGDNLVREINPDQDSTWVKCLKTREGRKNLLNKIWPTKKS